MKIYTRNIYLAGSILLMMSLFSQSCTTSKVAFLSSTTVPAAEGSVSVNKDDNNNYKINVSVSNLAKPDKIEPSGNTYVVWMVTDQNGTQNLGQLRTSHPLFSKAYKSSLTTVTSFVPVSFFITSEKAANIQSPEGETVLKTGTYQHKLSAR